MPLTDSPIFDVDAPCPRCKYNLRGLVQPICPECGFVFDPEQVRLDLAGAQRPMPLRWVLRHILPHPARFWQLPLAQTAHGPNIWQPVAIASVGAAVAPVGIALILIVMGYFDNGAPLAMVMLWAASLGAAMVACGLHELLCRVSLRVAGRPQSRREAARITRHAAAWLVVAMPASVTCGLMAVIVGVERGLQGSMPGWSPWLLLWPAAGLAAGLAGTVCWAMSVYAGARTVSQVSRKAGAWCVLCNPFLHMSALGAALLALLIAEVLLAA